MSVGEPRDTRPDAALAVQAVALGADAFPLLTTELGGSSARSASQASNSSCETTSTEASIRACSSPHSSAHCPGVGPLVVGLEPRLVRGPGNRVDLPAERRDPPGVDHVRVGRGDLEADRHPDGRLHRVDGDDAVGILVLPVELAAGHLDLELLLARGRVGHVLDAWQLDEDERGDQEEHDHRARPSTQARASSPRVPAPRPRSGPASGAGTSR